MTGDSSNTCPPRLDSCPSSVAHIPLAASATRHGPLTPTHLVARADAPNAVRRESDADDSNDGVGRPVLGARPPAA